MPQIDALQVFTQCTNLCHQVQPGTALVKAFRSWQIIITFSDFFKGSILQDSHVATWKCPVPIEVGVCCMSCPCFHKSNWADEWLRSVWFRQDAAAQEQYPPWSPWSCLRHANASNCLPNHTEMAILHQKKNDGWNDPFILVLGTDICTSYYNITKTH